MPTPNKKENKEEFISRCIRMLIREGKDSDQATAICYSLWEHKDKD